MKNTKAPLITTQAIWRRPCQIAALFLAVSGHASTSAETFFELSGKTEFEFTIYADEGQYTDQDYRHNSSIAIEPEFYWEWNDGNDSFIVKPFGRVDEHDEERTHGDIRELAWIHVGNNWELRTGIRKVFWGVTEFNHLVDIINQTDAVDSFDGEEKLGQPMVNFSYVANWGIVDAFILTGFRERTFAGEDGRLRGPFVIDTDRARFESDDEEHHIDYALRWSQSVSVFDIGLYWFDGTDRDPLLQPQTSGSTTTLIPFYQQITQIGFDLQATIDSWLWKFESIHKDSDNDTYYAIQSGFEYTFYGISQSATDLGLLLEYGWDERGEEDSTSLAQNDVYVGARLTLNDAADSTLLMGVSHDLDFQTQSFIIEASKRLNDRWTIAIEGLLFKADDLKDQAAVIEDDDRLQLTLERFF